MKFYETARTRILYICIFQYHFNMRKLKILLILIVIGVVIYFIYKSTQSHAQVTSSDQHAIHYEGLRAFYPESDEQGQIIDYKAFSIQYNEEAEQALWVVYLLTKKMVTNKLVKRYDKFLTDPNIETGSASPSDYKRSGYDKGHLCPAADMAWDKETQRECFYMSNMSPQTPSFNRGIWKELEEQVRKWAESNDSLIIITGPILKNYKKTIGDDQVAVPNAYFKVIADISAPSIKTIAFIMPNKDLKDSYFDYAVPVDSVEHITGMEFFDNSPTIEQTESSIRIDVWK
jgi:endonuclease G